MADQPNQTRPKARLAKGFRDIEADEIRGMKSMLRVIEETVPVQRIWLDTAENKETPRTGFEGEPPAAVIEVAAVLFGRGVPEVVEADDQHVRQRGEGRDVAAQVAVGAVGLDHHRHRIPTHVGTQALFDFQITWAMRTFIGRNRIDVSCIA